MYKLIPRACFCEKYWGYFNSSKPEEEIQGSCVRTVFGLNTEINGVNLRIQSEQRKIRTRNKSVFGHFSRSVGLPVFPIFSLVVLKKDF